MNDLADTLRRRAVYCSLSWRPSLSKQRQEACQEQVSLQLKGAAGRNSTMHAAPLSPALPLLICSIVFVLTYCKRERWCILPRHFEGLGSSRGSVASSVQTTHREGYSVNHREQLHSSCCHPPSRTEEQGDALALADVPPAVDRCCGKGIWNSSTASRGIMLNIERVPRRMLIKEVVCFLCFAGILLGIVATLASTLPIRTSTPIDLSRCRVYALIVSVWLSKSMV